MSNKKVLIVSYFFPPYPKVGGRRWAKFAKYLNRDGFDTHILCITYNQDSESPWNKDVEEYEEKVHRIRKDFIRPYYLKGLPKNLFQKIRWKWSLYVELFKKKRFGGIYNEQVVKNARELKSKASELINKYRYNVVIVTGGPFIVPYEITQLKEKFNTVKFIVDIRDPWTAGMKSKLTPKQLLIELQKEKATYQKADIVTTCSEFIIDDIKSRMPMSNKLFHLKHAFDKEDFDIEANLDRKGKNPGVIKMIYAGSLYTGMEKEIGKLIDFVKFLLSQNSIPKVELFCFTKDYSNLIRNSGVDQYFKYREIVSPRALSMIMAKTDLILQLRPKSEEGWENFLSSKFYELLYYRKPILYFGPTSTVEHFLENNKLGIWIDSYSNNTDFDKVLNDLNKQLIPDLNYDVLQHEYQKEVARLKELIV